MNLLLNYYYLHLHLYIVVLPPPSELLGSTAGPRFTSRAKEDSCKIVLLAVQRIHRQTHSHKTMFFACFLSAFLFSSMPSPSSSVSSPASNGRSWDHFEAQMCTNGAAWDSPETFCANLAVRQLIERRAGIPGLPPIRAPKALQLNDDDSIESEPERPCNGTPMRSHAAEKMMMFLLSTSTVSSLL